MKKFKEKKYVNILQIVGLICGLITVFSVPIGCFFESIICVWLFLIGLPLTGLCLFLHEMLETRRKYTSDFITYINNKVQNAKTLDEYIEIRKEFINLAVENGIFCLAYPKDLNKMLGNLNVIIDSLKKLEEFK